MQNDNQPPEFPGDGQERMASQQSTTSQTSSDNYFMTLPQFDERLNVPTVYSDSTTSREVVHQDSTTSNSPRVFTGDLNSQRPNQVPPSNNQPEKGMVFKLDLPTGSIVNGVDIATRAKLLIKQIDQLVKKELIVYHASRDRNEYLASMGFASHTSTKDQNQETLVQSQNSNGYVIINAYGEQYVIQQSPSSMPNGGPMHQPIMHPGHPQAMNNIANNYQVGNSMMTGSIDSPQTINYQQQSQQQFQSHPMHSQSARNIMAGQPGQYGNQQSSPYHQQNMHQQIVQQQTLPQQQYANNFNVPQQQQQQGILMLNNSNTIMLSPLPSAASMPQNLNFGNFNQTPQMINPGSNATYQMGNDMNSGNMAGNAVNSSYTGGYAVNANSNGGQMGQGQAQYPQQTFVGNQASQSQMGTANIEAPTQNQQGAQPATTTASSECNTSLIERLKTATNQQDKQRILIQIKNVAPALHQKLRYQNQQQVLLRRGNLMPGGQNYPVPGVNMQMATQPQQTAYVQQPQQPQQQQWYNQAQMQSINGFVFI